MSPSNGRPQRSHPKDRTLRYVCASRTWCIVGCDPCGRPLVSNPPTFVFFEVYCPQGERPFPYTNLLLTYRPMGGAFPLPYCFRSFQAFSIGQRLAQAVSLASRYVLIASAAGRVSIRSSTLKPVLRKSRIHSP